VAHADPLQEVLELARSEKALEGEAFAAFAAALRERAQIVLAERVGRAEEQVRGLQAQVRSMEAENAWRRTAMEGLEERVRGLEAEIAWRSDTIEGLTESARALQAEVAWRSETIGGLERDLAHRVDEHEKAAGAHQALQAHHRSVARQVIAECAAVAALPWTHVRQARRRLRALAALLQQEVA
jgi:uncharacterized coiled-coil protein SlyX